MGKWDTQTLQAGQDVAWNDRLLQSDQSKAEGNQDVNLERGAAAEAFQKFTIVQSAHGFSVLDCVRHNGTNFVAATADTEANSRVIGVVTEVIDTDNFVIQAGGRVTGASGLTAGSVHYLQDAGGLGTTAGTVGVPILLADSTTSGWLLPLGASGATFTGLSDTPSGYSGHAGKHAAVNSAENAVEFVDPAVVSVNAQTGTTYTLAASDAGKVVELTNAAAITLTVPPNSSVAFSVGTIIALEQGGAGTVTVSPGTGVTVNSKNSNLDLNGQYASAALRKDATDTWVLTGNLT